MQGIFFRFSKYDTDCRYQPRYRLGMKGPVDKEWFRSTFKKAGYKSANAFAQDVGLTGSKITLTLNGVRRLQAAEVNLFAEKLQVTPDEVAERFGIAHKPPAHMKVSGYVGAADRIVLFDDAQAEVVEEAITVPFFFYPGVILRIMGESMVPRYKPGEKVGIRLPGNAAPPLSMMGQDVIAKLNDGRMVLKTIFEGCGKGNYTLISVNSTVDPLINVDVEWVAPIDFHII